MHVGIISSNFYDNSLVNTEKWAHVCCVYSKYVPHRMRGDFMPRKSNLPNVVVDEELAKNKGTCSEIIQNVKNLAELNAKGKPGNAKELKERISAYFEYCMINDVRPGIETMCLALSCSRQSLFSWCRAEGVDKTYAEICRNAKQMVIAFLEQATMKNRINPTNYIFMMKNWANYADSITIIDDVTEKPKALSLSDLPNINEYVSKAKNAEEPIKNEKIELPFENMGKGNKTPLPYLVDEKFI